MICIADTRISMSRHAAYAYDKFEGGAFRNDNERVRNSRVITVELSALTKYQRISMAVWRAISICLRSVIRASWLAREKLSRLT